MASLSAARQTLLDLQRNPDTGEWAVPISSRQTNFNSNRGANILGEWLEAPVLADEATIEAPTVHPRYLKRKRDFQTLRQGENFKKPTLDGMIVCVLCEFGPLGNPELDESEYLTEFDRLYHAGLGNTNELQLYRQLRDFWNQFIATPSDDTLISKEERTPSIQVCQIQYHYDKCCRTRNIERILLDQVDDILLVQKNIRDNGLYVVAIDDSDSRTVETIPAEDVPNDDDSEEEGETGGSSSGTTRQKKKKIKPLVNPKSATQFREFNRSLVYTIKAYLDCRDAEYANGKSTKKRKVTIGPSNGKKGGKNTSFKDY